MTRRDQYQELAEPVRIGLLLDSMPSITDHAERIYDFVLEQYKGSGRFERGFEFVKLYPYGPPAGYIQNSIDGFHELASKGVIAIIGGHHADDTIALAPVADKLEVPFIGTGATAKGMSKWGFSICWSSIPHDVYTMASWLKKNDYRRVVITWDYADHAEENVEHFRNSCKRAGLRILGDERFPQIMVPNREEIFARTVTELSELKPDALAHFGTGPMSSAWAHHVAKSDWDIPRVMNDAFSGATAPNPETRARYEGWVGTTMWDDNNPITAKLYKDYMARYPGIDGPTPELVALFRDALTALIEGIMLAPILTRDGVRRGLEMLTCLPSACGGPRTCIGFNPHAHRGLQGADIMVLRRVKNGELLMEGYNEMF